MAGKQPVPLPAHLSLEQPLRQYFQNQGEAGIMELVVGLLGKIDPINPSPTFEQNLSVLANVLSTYGSELVTFNAVCDALSMLPDNIHPNYLSALLTPLKVSEATKCELCTICIARCKPAIASQAKAFLERIISLRYSEGRLPDVPPDVLHDMVLTLQNSGSLAVQDFLVQVVKKEQEKTKARAADHSQIGTPVTSNIWAILPLIQGKPAALSSANDTWANEPGSYSRKFLAVLPPAVRIESLLRDLGYDAMATVDVFKSVVSSLGVTLAAEHVARIMGMMAMTNSGQGIGNVMSVAPWNILDLPPVQEHPQSWNIDVFVATVNELVRGLDWKSLFGYLDYPEFRVMDQRGLITLVAIYRKAREEFPIAALFGRWKNVIAQFSLLRQAISVSKEVLDFSVVPREPTQDTIVQAFGHRTGNGAWNCSQTYETLLELSKTGQLFAACRELFINVMMDSPELVILSLCRIPHTGAPLHTEIYQALFPRFINACSIPVLRALWHINRPQFVSALSAMYLTHPTATTAPALRVVQEMGIENELLDDATPQLALEIALALAIKKKDYAVFETWLSGQLKAKKAPFAKSCLDYIRKKQELKSAEEPDTAAAAASNCPTEAVVACFKCLTAFAAEEKLPKELIDEIKQLHSEAYKVSVPKANVDPATLDDEAARLLEEMYKGRRTAKDTFALLKKLKVSAEPKDRALFGQVVNYLFDEYRFYSKYPDRQLKQTAEIFGSLLREDLMESMMTLTGLRYVLESLKEPRTAHFRFGTWALAEFYERLSQWPQYCKNLLEIPTFLSDAPDLAEKVREILRQAQEGGSIGMVRMPTSATSDTSLVSQVAEIDKVLEPADNTRDKIHFIFNNLSDDAVTKKAAELAGMLTSETLPWLTKYVVVRRAALEPNNHLLYANLMTALATQVTSTYPQLMRVLTRRTIKYCRFMFGSERVVVSTDERVVLKNLGSWLGELTLARDKPILFVDMDLRSVLIEAYKKNTLIAVIPFVCNVLNSATKGTVFLPPNPWVMSIVRMMVELHEANELKGNLLIATELLCQNLGVDMREVKPTEYFRNGAPYTTDFGEIKAAGPVMQALQHQGQPAGRLSASVPALPLEVLAAHLCMSPSELNENQVLLKLLADVKCSSFLPCFAPGQPSVQVGNHQIVAPQLQAHLVALAIEKSLREAIAGTIERTVAIACDTTKEIVLKDFAMEPNDQKLTVAAHNMVQCLASSLALVTCREPLRNSMATSIKQALNNHLIQAGLGGQSALDQVSQQAAADNVDVAYELVEMRLREKATKDIDELLSSATAARRKALEQGSQYVDTSVLYPRDKAVAPRFPRDLPVPLYVRQAGLLQLHHQVYDDYRRLASSVHAEPSAAARAQMPIPSEPKLDQLLHAAPPPSMSSIPVPGPAAPQTLMVDKAVLAQTVEKFSAVLGKLDRSIMKVAPQYPTLASLPPNQDISLFLSQIPQFISRNNARRDGAIACAAVVFKRLMLPDRLDLYREVHVAMLEGIARVVQDLPKEVTGWVSMSVQEDDQRLNPKVIVQLLRSKLLIHQDYITTLTRSLLGTGGRLSFELAHWLLENRLLEGDVSQLSEAIHVSAARYSAQVQGVHRPGAGPTVSPPGPVPVQISPAGLPLPPLVPVASDVLSRMRSMVSGSPSTQARTLTYVVDVQGKYPELSPDLRAQLLYLLDDWVLCYLTPQVPMLKAVQLFGSFLEENGLSRDIGQSVLFPYLTEVSVLSVTEDQNPARKYAVVDAVCYLWTSIARGLTIPNPAQKVAETIGKIVSRLCRMLAANLTKLPPAQVQDNVPLPQRVFFRTMVTLLTNWTTPDPVLDVVQTSTLSTVAAALHVLRPTEFPTFAFTWFELMSHNRLLPRLLTAKEEKGWPEAHLLIEDMFVFMEPLLAAGQLSKEARVLYNGVLRLLLLLLHDFPEFLCEYYLSLCMRIPLNCVQMRNMALSAFPRRMRLPDPFSDDLKVDRLPEMRQLPRVRTDFGTFISSVDNGVLKADVDAFLRKDKMEARTDTVFMTNFKNRLKNTPQDISTKMATYSAEIMNCLVMYVGAQALGPMDKDPRQREVVEAAFTTHGICTEFFYKMLVELDDEGCYSFLNALANQLRFPNVFTHYFSCLVIYLFARADKEKHKEEITRVLLERLIVNRPHPWGLLVTFIELIKNPNYALLEYSFTKRAPEIDQLFQSVAKSIISSSQSTGVAH